MPIVGGLDIHRKADHLRLPRYGDWGRSSAGRSPQLTGSTCGPGWPGSSARTTSRSRWRGARAGGMSRRSWLQPGSPRIWVSLLDTAALRGRKRHAKTDKTDSRHLRALLAEGRLPECWVAAQILEYRALPGDLPRPAPRAHRPGAAARCSSIRAPRR